MTTILSDYNKSILIELLNTNRQIIVVHGDDIDDYYTDSCYDIITMMMMISLITDRKYGVAIAFIL
ncbi:hypothetical protein C7243_004463 [Shigella flexneri]|nr:hypothetical protein [Escherichia coli]EFP4273946.1 hypothetical protein [Shigella flexneri]EFF1847947.1 hypothetical protein [Escherichia coli]EFP4274340.1 hypothetical protein [Shigella flexneri]EFP5991180.1 hypothetical protein [Shigella flexneri]